MRLPTARDVERLARLEVPRLSLSARALLRRDPPWETWRDALNALHHRAPLREARVAAALARAARLERRPDLAARFRLLEARGLLRGGSPAAAVRAFARAEGELHRVGMPERAAAAAAARVDALAHAGRLAEALDVARDAQRRLHGPHLAGARAHLAINRANALRLLGDVDGARADYERAGRVLAALGDAGNAAIAGLNAGVALLEAGQPDVAHDCFVRAEHAFLALGRADMAHEARYDAACADVRRGRLGAGILALERLVHEHEQAGLVRRASLCRMDLADAVGRAGDGPGAQRLAERAAEGFRATGARAERAEALWVAAAAQGRDPVGQRRRARQAERLARASGRTALVLRCRLLGATERTAGRLRVLRQVERAARASGQSELAAQAALLRAHALVEAGRLPAARLALAAPGLARSSNPWLRVGAQVAAAQVDAGVGRLGAARRRLDAACAFLDGVERALPGAWLRSTFLVERFDPWLAQIELLLRTGRPRERREAARRLDLLAARRFRAQGPVPRADARMRALRGRLEALYDRLARPAGRGAGGARGAAAGMPWVRARARRLERALAGRWRSLERTSRSRGSRSVARGAAPLTAGQVALHLWCHGPRVSALVERPQGVEPVHEVATLASLQRDVEELGFEVRRAAVPHGAGLPVGALHGVQRSLAALSETLLAPLRSGPWPEELFLVLDPALPDLPFECLPHAGTLLADATRLLRVPARGARAPVRPAGRGRALVTLGESDLPGVAEEVRALRRSTTVCNGSAATRSALSKLLATRAVVHVAGHGWSASEAPALAGVRLADGWYGAGDVPPHVAATLVVLAACRTGRAAGPEASAWGGLPSRLLAAGARHVLWTADDVDDAVSARFFTRLHERLGLEADVRVAFGSTLADLARGSDAAGSLVPLLPFRLSGFAP